MRLLFLVCGSVAFLACLTVQAQPAPTSARQSVAALLDGFHRAAAQADEEGYFEHFAQRAVFLGTDPEERWSVEAFRAYAHKHFSQGKGWTYVPSERSIVFGPERRVAWFHEVVTHEAYGRCRGTGTVIRERGAWKIAQYSLSLPLPNEKFKAIAADVRRSAKR